MKHYRDRYSLECDNIIHFDNEKYTLVEVKISLSKIKEPEFLMVITKTDLAYTIQEGILVVPIECLKN